MADQAQNESKQPKAKTVAEDMDSRRIFPNATEAAAYLTATAQAIGEDFAKQTIAAPGLDAEGNFDKEIYTDETAVMVSVLRNKQKVKAIVVAPIPTLDQLIGNEAGRAWVDKIIAKELNHVAVRQLREAEDVSTVVDQMPTTMEAYITSSREAGGIMETYDELYKLISATMGSKLPVWQKARFIKSELKKAMESKGYALEYYPALEDYKGQSLFVTALNLGINAAKRKGLDPTIFERWAATRDAKAFNPAETDEDEDELNLDSLTDSLLAEDEAPATEGETEDTANAEEAAAPDSEGEATEPATA